MNSGRTILLVEDNPSDIALTRRALRKAGILNEVVAVEDGQAALDYLLGADAERRVQLLPAVVLLDLNLPMVSGFEVLERIRANDRTRRLPVVILTTSNEPAEIGRGYDLGVNSYLVKPVDFAQFATVVENVGLYWLLLNGPPPE